MQIRMVKEGRDGAVQSQMGIVSPVAGVFQKIQIVVIHLVGVGHPMQMKRPVQLVVVSVVGTKYRSQMKTSLPGMQPLPWMGTSRLVGIKMVTGAIRKLPRRVVAGIRVRLAMEKMAQVVCGRMLRIMTVHLLDGKIIVVHLLDGVKATGLKVEQVKLVGIRIVLGVVKAIGTQEVVLVTITVKTVEEVEVGEAGVGEVTVAVSEVGVDRTVAVSEVGVDGTVEVEVALAGAGLEVENLIGENMVVEVDLTERDSVVGGALEVEEEVTGITEKTTQIRTNPPAGVKAQTMMARDGRAPAMETVGSPETVTMVQVQVGTNQKTVHPRGALGTIRVQVGTNQKTMLLTGDLGIREATTTISVMH